MTQIRQMTTDFFVADAILPKAIPVIPTVLSRHPDRHSTSSRPPLHVIPTEVEGSLNKLEMTYEAFRDPSTSLRVTGKCMALATKKICGHLSNLCHLCAIFRRAKRFYNHCKKISRRAKRLYNHCKMISRRAKRLYNHCKMISRRAKGFTIIAR